MIPPSLNVAFLILLFSWAYPTMVVAETTAQFAVTRAHNLSQPVKTTPPPAVLPTLPSSRLILWERCKPATDANEDTRDVCCRGNYRCSHPHCRKASSCSMPFFKELLWCFHDSCPEKSKPVAIPRPKRSPRPTIPPTVSHSPFPQSPSPVSFDTALPSPSVSPHDISLTRSPTPSSLPVISNPLDLSNSCTGIRTRREIRDLSISERLDWQQALLSLTEPVDGGMSEWDKLIQAHVDHGDEAHGGAYFLPWHRMQLLHLENAIRRTRPDFVLPYWDWTIDAANAAMSPVWKANLAGGARKGYGITDGAFANLEAKLPWPHLVTRDFDSNVDYTLPQLWTRADIDDLIRSQPWPAFADAVEAAHALVHVSIGGDMMDTRTASNDPVFWLLHGFVDAIFDSRIRANGPEEFGGSHDFFDGTRPADQSFILHPFGTSVRNAMHLSCVRYAPSSIMGRSLRHAPAALPPDACALGKFASNKTQSVSRCRRGFRVLRSQRESAHT